MRGRSKKRSWRQGQKPKMKKFFKKQALKDERQMNKKESQDDSSQ